MPIIADKTKVIRSLKILKIAALKIKANFRERSKKSQIKEKANKRQNGRRFKLAQAAS